MCQGLAIAAGLYLCMPMAMGADVPRVIFDTDMTGDCDDCGALAVLHALADRGEVEILGCVASFGANPYVVGCIDAINTYYGRGDLPIGAEQGDFGRPDSRYAEAVAKDTARYGHRRVRKEDVPDLVSVYRKLLAAQPDGSVTIVTVGRLKGLHDLLVSGPDEHSDLDGEALVRQKVPRWVCMGGHFPNTEGKKEANFCASGGADYTKAVVERWPTQAWFSGFEIGWEIMTGPELLKQSDDNPVARAYRLFFEADGANPKPTARQSWDQTAVLLAVRGPEPWWDVVSRGSTQVDEEGVNLWREMPDLDHAYIVRKTDVASVTAEISALMCRPPRRAR